MIELMALAGGGFDIRNMTFSAFNVASRYCLHHTMVKYKNQLVWVGGSVTGVGERYFDYLNGTVWSAMPKLLPEARMCHNTVVIGDKLYLWGGQISNTLAPKMYTYDFITQVWEDQGNIPVNVAFSDCCAIGTKLYYFGGMLTGVNDATPASFPSYEYDTVTKTWRNLNIALSGRHNLSAAAYENKIYILGGCRNNNYLKELWCYDTVTGTLTAKKAPPQAISSRCQFVNFKGWLVMMFGIINSGYSPNPICYRYEPTLDIWEEWPPNPSFSRSYSGCVVDGNKIYMFGGFNGSVGLSDAIVLK